MQHVQLQNHSLEQHHMFRHPVFSKVFHIILTFTAPFDYGKRKPKIKI